MKSLYIASLSICLLIIQSNAFAATEDLVLKLDDVMSLVYVVPFFFLSFFIFLFAKVRRNRKQKRPLGFFAITPHRPQKFFPLDENVQNMVPVVDALADDQTNVYSNLTKITLAVKPSGVFLEDKNYKISILINRRRSRRCMLNDGDILDMGELTIMFQSPKPKGQKQEYKGQSSNHVIPRVRKTHSKIIKSSPSLIPADSRQKTFYLTKNITFIGRSEMNDLNPKSKTVSSMHSKLERVAGRYKLTDLSSSQGTFVNGRRIDSKLLNDGDEISFESIKYTFSISGRAR